MEQENLQTEPYLNTVTPLSKYLSMALFVVLPFIGGYVGYVYAPEKVVEVERVIEVKKDSITTEGISDSGINFTNPVREDAYTTYEVKNGLVTGEWYAVYGPNNHGGSAIYFIPFNKIGVMSDRFKLSSNKDSIASMFGIEFAELEKTGEDCSLEGGRATIDISEYNVLEAEMGATDYAIVGEIVVFTEPTEKSCW